MRFAGLLFDPPGAVKAELAPPAVKEPDLDVLSPDFTQNPLNLVTNPINLVIKSIKSGM